MKKFSNFNFKIRSTYARNKTLISAPLLDLPQRKEIIINGSFVIPRHNLEYDFIYNALKSNPNQRATIEIRNDIDIDNNFVFRIPCRMNIVSTVPSSKIVPLRISFETEYRIGETNDGFSFDVEYPIDLT